MLDVISLALAWPAGYPFLGPSLVFAILYYWSRSGLGSIPECNGLGREPYGKLSFFSFVIQAGLFKRAVVRCAKII